MKYFFQDKQYWQDKGKNQMYKTQIVGIISIHHKCEIEKSVPRITDWHHEACRGMTIVDAE